MPVFSSPGVYTREITVGALPNNASALTPVFVGTAKKGPIGVPTLITSSAQYVDVFGEPFPESYLGYAVLAFFEEGSGCYVMRVAVELEDGLDPDLAAIAVDLSGAKVEGWGRIPLFSGIDYGRISLREVTADAPAVFHAASVSSVSYYDADSSTTFGSTSATLAVTGTYTGAIDDFFSVVITGDPNLSAAAALDGATYQVVKGSDGTVVAEGVLNESALGQSDPISIGDGLTIKIVVSSGILGSSDSFTFSVVPDNRKFQVSVENTAGAEYTMPTASYTTVESLVDAINNLLSAENWLAVSYIDANGVTVPQIRTQAAGRWVQLVGTKGWALELGASLYAFDVPRSHLYASNPETYTITNQNNKISIKVIGESETKTSTSTIATGTNILGSQLASSLAATGVIDGTRYYSALTIYDVDGERHVLIITDVGNALTSQLQLVANYSQIKTLRFAEELGIAAPYKRGYRGFWDARVSLPASSVDDDAVPASCSDPSSDECASDTSYFSNVVGWFVASSAGTWVDGYGVTLDNYTEGVGDVTGRFKITIRDAAGITVDEIADVSFDKTADRYVGNVINPGTKYGGRNGNAFINWEPRPTYLAYDSTASDYEVRQPATFASRAFLGAANGIPTDAAFSSDLDAALIGNPALSTGIYALQNPETFQFDVLATPGFSSGTVIGQCLQLCEGRGDVVYLVDPPFGLRPQQVVDWHNGMLTSDLAVSINSSYGSLFWSWIKYFDQFSNAEIWVPPSGHISAVFARTSRVAERWSAAAGLQRGRILTGLDVEFQPDLGARNLLQGGGNAVNPIVKFPQEGLVVYGSKTLDRSGLSANEVTDRMLLNYIKREGTRILRQFLWEPNDSILWAQVRSSLEPFMADIQARRGTSGYSVVCDATNNTDERRDRKELWVTIFVKPTPTAQIVVLNLVNLRQSASFSSQEVLAAGGIIG